MWVKLNKAITVFKSRGILPLLRIIWARMSSSESGPKSQLDQLKGLIGLEIGGPSKGVFDENGILPVYPIVERLDACNFSAHTVWEGDLKEGDTFFYSENKGPGRQIVCDAVNLSNVDSGVYDFVLSSHVLEHIANPIKALKEWLRVLRPGGMLVVILPARELTFDHNRPITQMEHLIDDYNKNIQEDDLSHMEEILALHDLSLDPAAGKFEEFKQRSMDNFNNRCLHQHVFDEKLILELLKYLDVKIVCSEVINAYHITVVARKRQ